MTKKTVLQTVSPFDLTDAEIYQRVAQDGKRAMMTALTAHRFCSAGLHFQGSSRSSRLIL